MTIKELINSANTRVVNLQQAEFTPEAELAALELQLAMAKMLYALIEKGTNSNVSSSSK